MTFALKPDRIGILSLLVCALCLAPDPVLSGDRAPAFVLELTGSEGVEITGTCDVETASGPRRLALEGPVPQQLRLIGRALNCRIRKGDGPGNLSVVVSKNGRTVSRSQSNAAHGLISVAVN